MSFDPKDAGDMGSAVSGLVAILAALTAFFTAPFKIFETKRGADAKFVKKVEENGTRAYVHPDDFQRLETTLNDYIKESREWRDKFMK